MMIVRILAALALSLLTFGAQSGPQQMLLAGGAQPIFFLPLQSTLVPTTSSGSATPTYSRASTALVPDWENVLRGAASGEVRFVGARRVSTIVSTKSENWTDGSWTKTTMTATATTLTATGANSTVLQTNSGGAGAAPYRLRVRMSRITGSGSVQLTLDGTTWTTVTLTGSAQVFSIAQTTTGNPTFGIRIVTSGDAINADQIMVEDTIGQSNSNPSEYVSIGVLAAPYNGAGTDGVQYFKTLNGNTISSNVVTETTGALITSANSSTVATDASGPLGFLQEEARTNIVKQSVDISNVGGNNVWNVSQATVALNQTTDPTGGSAASWLREDNTNNDHQVYWPYTGATAAAYTVSAYLKQKERTWAFLSFTATTTTGAYFDLANGVVGNVDAGYTATITPAANGFYRCTITKTATVATWYVKVETASANGSVTYTGTTNSGIYVWGVQLELGAYATSHIATTGVAKTRAADLLTYVFSGNADATVGTAYAETKTLWSTASNSSNLIGFSTATSGPLYNNAEAATIVRVNDGTNNVSKTGLSDMSSGVRKLASSWTGSTLSVTGGGAAAATGTFDGNMGSTAIAIGSGTGGAGPWNGYIRNVKVYGTAEGVAALTN